MTQRAKCLWDCDHHVVTRRVDWGLQKGIYTQVHLLMLYSVGMLHLNRTDVLLKRAQCEQSTGGDLPLESQKMKSTWQTCGAFVPRNYSVHELPQTASNLYFALIRAGKKTFSVFNMHAPLLCLWNNQNHIIYSTACIPFISFQIKSCLRFIFIKYFWSNIDHTFYPCVLSYLFLMWFLILILYLCFYIF